MGRLTTILVALALASCGGTPAAEVRQTTEHSAPDQAEAPARVVVSIVGTNDLHGHIAALPLLAGYVANLRRSREAAGGAVLLVDAGDMFQGTIESNRTEGASVVEAYDVLGYHAAAVGNHEFDFGPVGPATTPQQEDDDPRGALKARAAEADYAFLVANILDGETGERVDWPDMPPTWVADVAGVRVGVIGVSTEETLRTTIRANVEDLAMAPLAETIAREARRLREREGVGPVVVAAHAGGECEHHEQPEDLSSCTPDAEIFEVARALPDGAVDAIVAGHSHRAIAHRVAGVPIIESWAYGVAFGRIDLVVDPGSGRVVESLIHPPRRLCQDDAPFDSCDPGTYEGAPVERDPRVAEAIADELAAAEELKRRPAGVTIEGDMPAVYGSESALGNLLADLILDLRTGADIALMNGGGIRADFAEGPLTYGQLYETFPFDNRFATVRTTVADLEALIVRNLQRESGFLSLAGASVRARCDGGELEVELRRPGGRRLRERETVTIVTSDYIATAEEGAFGEGAQIELDQDELMREAIFEKLRERGGVLEAAMLYDPEQPRVSFPGERPVRCEPEDAE